MFTQVRGGFSHSRFLGFAVSRVHRFAHSQFPWFPLCAVLMFRFSQVHALSLARFPALPRSRPAARVVALHLGRRDFRHPSGSSSICAARALGCRDAQLLGCSVARRLGRCRGSGLSRLRATPLDDSPGIPACISSGMHLVGHLAGSPSPSLPRGLAHPPSRRLTVSPASHRGAPQARQRASAPARRWLSVPALADRWGASPAGIHCLQLTGTGSQVLAFSGSRFLGVGHSRVLAPPDSGCPARTDSPHVGHFLADTPACLRYRTVTRR